MKPLLRQSGRVEGVGNKLLDEVEADVEAAMQNGGGVVRRARASIWEVARALCVPVLSLDRSAAAAAAVVVGGQP